MIRIDQVHYTYPSRYQTVEALRGVSCSFEKGRIHAIIGKSGSGKSTLLTLLSGLDLPTSGRILVNGSDLSNINRNQYRRQQIAVIYQSLNLFPLLTVLENIMYPMRLNGTSRKEASVKALELLKQVDLSEAYARKLPGMLSGGEQQRVAIARALSMSGRIILADEPTGNLDTQNTANIIQILSGLAHERGYCVIVATHDDAVASRSDQVYEMKDGIVAE